MTVNIDKLQQLCQEIVAALPENGTFVLVINVPIEDDKAESGLMSNESCYHCVANMLALATTIAAKKHEEDINATRH